MRNYIIQLGESVLTGGEISFEQVAALENVKGADLYFLLAYASKIREQFCGDKIDLCSIVSARTGGCRENCAFCAQSVHHGTKIKSEVNLDEEDILVKARAVEKLGAHHFDIVTSGLGYKIYDAEFQHILKIFRRLKKEINITLCACLGVIGQAEAQALKEAGVSRYNHNLEAAESFFSQIVTTHSYQQREQTIRAVKKAGMEVCTGGIIGMGETFIQRVELAFALRNLEVDSVPLNILNPISGTPLEGRQRLSPLEVMKTLAVFRFILPQQIIKLAGGREINLRSLQSLSFLSGINGMLVGNYLTTEGQSVETDLAILNDLELRY